MGNWRKSQLTISGLLGTWAHGRFYIASKNLCFALFIWPSTASRSFAMRRTLGVRTNRIEGQCQTAIRNEGTEIETI